MFRKSGESAVRSTRQARTASTGLSDDRRAQVCCGTAEDDVVPDTASSFMQALFDHFAPLLLAWWHSLSVIHALVVAVVSLACLAVVAVLVFEWLRGPVSLRVLEGVRLVEPAKLARRTAYPEKAKRPTQLMFGQVPWPAELEDKHALIVGTTGVGKSTLIRQILSRLRKPNQRAIVVDLNGEFAAKFRTSGDWVFNPLDNSSVKWNPISEIKAPGDIDGVLKAMLPTGSTAEEENWRGYARQFLRAVMFRLHEVGELTLERLRHYVMDAGDKELAAFLQDGTQSVRLQSNNMASTVKSIAQGCVQELALAAVTPDFSVRQWVRKGSGFIFITPRDRDRAALSTLVDTFMNLAVAEAMSAPPGKRFRPIAIIVDELASFEFDDLEGVLEKGRKFGVVAFAGIQNVAQLRKKFGVDGATTLLACFRTKIVFNPGDADTAMRMAEEIGRQTVERREVAHSHSSTTSSQTTSWRREERLVVSPDDLQRLPDLTAYIKLGGDYPVAKILVPKPRPA